MAATNMNNLTTLIKRLEAATSRLEDIASSTVELPRALPALQQNQTSTRSGRSSASTSAAAPAPSSGNAAPPPLISAFVPQLPAEPLPESIREYDAFLSKAVVRFSKLSKEIGGLVAEQADKLVQGLKEQRNFLLISTKAKKPDINGSEMQVYQDILAPINEALIAVTSVKDANRGSPVFNQLGAVSDGAIVLAWVTVEPKPFKHVEESLSSAQYCGNRVLRDFKESDPKQVEWVQSFYQIFRDLAEYVKEYFPHGVTWNSKGLPAQDVKKALARAFVAPAADEASLPSPPLPPGPAPILQINEVQKDSDAPSGFDAVFTALNQGEAVTEGLRKVDRSQMTHKNPELRKSSMVSESSSRRAKSPAPGKRPKPESMRVKKPPVKELVGTSWTIENYEKEPAPVEIEADLNQSILVSRCNNMTVIIKGKAKAVNVENTNRVSLVVDSLVSTVDAVKSSNFALQVMGTIPTVMLDQIDSAQIYLSKASISTRVYSSNSAGINVNVLPEDPDGDYKEFPMPSQICSYWDETKGEMVNEIVSHM